MRRQPWVALILGIWMGSMLTVASPTASARQASPVSELPGDLPPAACTVTPRSLAAISALLATPKRRQPALGDSGGRGAGTGDRRRFPGADHD